MAGFLVVTHCPLLGYAVVFLLVGRTEKIVRVKIAIRDLSALFYTARKLLCSLYLQEVGVGCMSVCFLCYFKCNIYSSFFVIFQLLVGFLESSSYTFWCQHFSYGSHTQDQEILLAFTS